MKEKDPFKMLQNVDDNIGEIDTDRVAVGDKIEKESYSSYSYNMVRRAREKCKLRGVDIPYLQYSVDSPERPRTLFLVLGIISTILLLGVVALITLLTINTIAPLFMNLIGATQELTIRHEWDIFGFGLAVGSLTSFFLWAMVLVFVVFAVAVVVIFVLLTIRMFAFARLSIQEIAIGHEMKNMIKRVITTIVIIVAIAVGIFVVVENMPTKGIIVLSASAGVFVAIFGTILAFLILEKKKANKKFLELPFEEQEDFRLHARALERACMRVRRKNSFTNHADIDF